MALNLGRLAGVWNELKRAGEPEFTERLHQPNKLIIADNPSESAADLLFDRIRLHKTPIVGVSGCPSLNDFYRRLREIRNLKENFMHDWEMFVLDEYYGVPPPLSTKQRIHDLYLNRPDAAEKHRCHATFVSDYVGHNFSFEKAIRNHDRLDVAVVSVADDGSIASNPPGSPFNSPSRYVHLSDALMQIAKNEFQDSSDTPHSAFVVGLDTIRGAREIVVVAVGPSAGAQLYSAYENAPDISNPASLLQYCRNVTIVADPTAQYAIDPFKHYGWSVCPSCSA